MCDSCKKAAHRFVIRYKDSFEHRTNDGDEIVEAKRFLFYEVGRFVLNSYMFEETESGFGATYYGSIDDFKCEMFIIGKQVVFGFSENDSPVYYIGAKKAEIVLMVQSFLKKSLLKLFISKKIYYMYSLRIGYLVLGGRRNRELIKTCRMTTLPVVLLILNFCVLIR